MRGDGASRSIYDAACPCLCNGLLCVIDDVTKSSRSSRMIGPPISWRCMAAADLSEARLCALAPAIEDWLSKLPNGAILRGTGFSRCVIVMLRRGISRSDLEKELFDLLDGDSHQVDAFVQYLRAWGRVPVQPVRAPSPPAVGANHQSTLGGSAQWTLRHPKVARHTRAPALEWKIVFFHDSENLVLRPLPHSQFSSTSSSSSPPPTQSFGVNAQRAIVRHIVATCFTSASDDAPSDDFVDAVIHRNFTWYYVSKPVNAASCPKQKFRITDATARDLVDIGSVHFTTAMSGKDDAVDKEIERLMAVERRNHRFSTRSYLFVLGSGDRDFAQVSFPHSACICLLTQNTLK
jgi:hypothetical protein